MTPALVSPRNRGQSRRASGSVIVPSLMIHSAARSASEGREPAPAVRPAAGLLLDVNGQGRNDTVPLHDLQELGRR